MTMPTFTDGTVVHQGDLNLLSTGINNLSTYSLGAVPPRSYVPTLKLRKNAQQTIPTNANTNVSWDTIDVNNDSMFTLSANTVITIQTAGSYAVFAEFGWVQNSTGGRVLWVNKNGTNPTTAGIGIDEQAASGPVSTSRGNTHHIANLLPNCVVGDTFYVVVFQSSGGGLANVPNTLPPLCSLVCYRVGP
jgi:hypothetical protein